MVYTHEVLVYGLWKGESVVSLLEHTRPTNKSA